MLGGQHLHEPVLGVVRVLVLVDEDVPEAVLVVLEDLWEGPQELDGDHEQVVEVHCRGLEHPLLVQPVHVGDPLVIGAAPLGGEGLEVDELVLGVRDRGADALRRELLRVEVEVPHAHLDEAPGIGVVVDREGRAVSEHRGVASQHPNARAVEGGHPHPASHPAADEVLDPLLHLVGGLVGERDRQDLVRGHAPVTDEMGDAVGEHPGLARTGTGDDEHGTVGGRDGLALNGIEVGEQRRFGHGRRSIRGGRVRNHGSVIQVPGPPPRAPLGPSTAASAGRARIPGRRRSPWRTA